MYLEREKDFIICQMKTAFQRFAASGPRDIRQKSGEVLFTLGDLNFQAFSALCDEPPYRNRIQLLATAKEPTIKLRLAAGVDSLRQSKILIEHYSKHCQN